MKTTLSRLLGAHPMRTLGIAGAAVVTTLALVAPSTALAGLSVFGGPRQRRQLGRWFAAVQAGRELPERQLPTITGVSTDPVPPPSRWRDRDPVAAARLAACRDAVATLAEQHTVLAQNLLASDVVRRLAWEPPPLEEPSVQKRLTELGARPWQVELTAAALTAALDVPQTTASRPAPDVEM